MLAVLVVLAGIALGASAWVSRPLFSEILDPATLAQVEIAPPDEALSFARYRAADGSLRLLLVTAMSDGTVTGLELDAAGAAPAGDPIALYREFGYDAIAALATVGAVPVTVPVSQLALPFDARAHNVAIGANFSEHARESQIEDSPFVFPKLAQPTLWSSEVTRAPSTLLDYEAELGLVLIDDLRGAPQQPRMGLVLANELTDRWALVKNLKAGSTMGTTGFVDGKSREGFAPIGPLLVIPRDLEGFVARLELALWVNGRLRQRDGTANMTWGPSQILREVFGRSALRYRHGNGAVPLLPGIDLLPAGTIIFAGTPAGVVFKPLNLWNPWVYLRPGDEVVVRGRFLGTITNRIR
ncbi:MAG TPA: fumarylacetoacetate hydrolase family protein [Verrucomicrobiae bacterium]|nr:fumarylacetoacetate hydrolase family protein [Verrucomicrobiae bacterium]